MFKRRLIVLILMCHIHIGLGQINVYTLHPNSRLYPFKHVIIENDSLKNILTHFYFACRESNIAKSRTIYESLELNLNKDSWEVKNGILAFNKAYYYRINGNIDKAFKYYIDSKELFKKYGDSTSMQWAELGLINCDYLLNQRAVAFKKYLELYDKVDEKNTLLRSTLSYNIAVSYHEKYLLSDSIEVKENSTKNALHYYHLTLKDNIKSMDYLGASHTYCLLGAFNSILNKNLLAESQLDSAMIYAIQSEIPSQIAFININHGYHMVENGAFKKGIEKINLALTYYSANKIYNMASLANLRKAQSFALYNQYDSAYFNALERVRNKDLYFAESMVDKSAFYEVEFKTKALQTETIQQQQEIERINSEKLQIENQRLTLGIWVLILILVLLITLVIFWYYTKNRKRKLALQKQELEINMQRNLISETIRLQDEDRLRLGRDIHDGICQTITGIKLQQIRLLKESDQQNPDFQKKLKSSIELIEQLYKEARDVSHELAPPGIAHNSLKDLIWDICKQMFDGIKVTLNAEALNENIFENYPDKKLNLVRIFQELATNIVKHSEATEVNIQVYERKKYLIFRIKDNGIGINKEESEEGLGLQSIKYRVSLLSGTFNLENDQGLICLLKIPLA